MNILFSVRIASVARDLLITHEARQTLAASEVWAAFASKHSPIGLPSSSNHGGD